jgi:hypothetical protein
MTDKSSAWRMVGTDLAYWNSENGGISSANGKFVCETCAKEFPFDWVCECGCKDKWVLARGNGLPGIFCHNCGEGRIAWTCPACDSAQRLFLAFHYDTSQFTLKKRKGFWSRIFTS